jgi:hypothetical protein
MNWIVAWMEETRNKYKVWWNNLLENKQMKSRLNMEHTTVKLVKSELNGNPPLLKNVSGPKNYDVKN